MRRHLSWIAGLAVIAAAGILLAVALHPPVAQAPTATAGGSPRHAGASGSGHGTASASSPASVSPRPTVRATPPPGSASLAPEAGTPPEGYRAPPDAFDPASIRWAGDAVTGSAQEKRFGLWTAALDGSDLREIVRGEIGTGPVVLGGNGAVGFVRVGPDRHTPLFVALPGQPPSERLPWVSEVAAAPSGFVANALEPGPDGVARDAGVWRVAPTGERVPLLPPELGPRCSEELFGERTRAGIAVDADGSRVASGICRPGAADESAFRLDVEVATPDGNVRLADAGRPLGFDAAGRLIAQSDVGFRAFDVATGSATSVDGDAGGQARLSADGRYLVTYAGGPELVAHDLVAGGTQRWHISTDAGFDLTAFGEGSRVVLESYASFPSDVVLPGWHIVVDLDEGWLGYLPPIAPFRDDPPE